MSYWTIESSDSLLVEHVHLAESDHKHFLISPSSP